MRACAAGPVILTRYREPSAVFLLGTKTEMMSAEEANAALSQGKADLALIPRGLDEKPHLSNRRPVRSRASRASTSMGASICGLS